MKFALIFLLSALVVMSQQQFLRARPRGVVWWSPLDNLHLSRQMEQPSYDDDHQLEDIPATRSSFGFRRQYRPSRPINYVQQNEEFNVPEFDAADESEQVVEYPDTQFRISSFKRLNKNGGRIFYGSTINNPFYKTATFTVTSTVTTLGSLVICVPPNNLAAVPAPTCAGRKKREIQDSEVNQFPIAPSETVKLMPTALPSSLDLIRESRQVQQGLDNLVSSKEEAAGVIDSGVVASSDEKDQQQQMRDKRFFGGGIAASTTLITYSFVRATVTSTVLLDPTGANLAACLPAGYVVCA